MSQQAQHMTQLGASRLQGIHLGFLAARMKSWPKGPKTLGESEKLVIMFDEYLSYIHSTSALWICDMCVYMYVCLYIYICSKLTGWALFFTKQCVTDDKWRPCWDDRSSKMGQFCPSCEGFSKLTCFWDLFTKYPRKIIPWTVGGSCFIMFLWWDKPRIKDLPSGNLT